MDRRTFNQNLCVGTTALITGGALAQIGCGGKSIANEISIIISTATELKPLLPNQSALLDKISLVANDFNKAYSAGDFNSARQFFDSLATNISTLANDIGADNPRISFLVALVSVAVHAVAALLSEQAATAPAIAKAARSTAPASTDRVEKMASKASAQSVLSAVKF